MAACSTSTEAPKYEFIGSYTRYSSWTSRVETVLKYFSIPYTPQIVHLTKVPSVSPSSLVPLLKIPTLSPRLQINDSLAILEFLAEDNPALDLWPQDQILRAIARSAVAEMHSGFAEIRNTYHTNFVARYTGTIPVSGKAQKEIERLLEIWGNARRVTSERLGERDEGFLFGGFGIADAFFWPVLWRFRTYNLPLSNASPEVLAWAKKMWSDPKMKEIISDYFRQAEDPGTRIEKYEDIFAGNPDIECGRFEENWEFGVSI